MSNDTNSSATPAADPYETPLKAASPHPTRWVVRILGSCNMLFGLLGAVFYALTAVGILIGRARPGSTLGLMKANQAYAIFKTIEVASAMAASLVLIVAGVGLVAHRRWARDATIAYAWYAIVACLIGSIVHYYAIVKPALERMIAAGQSDFIPAAYFVFVAGSSYILYPALLLRELRRKSVDEVLLPRSDAL